MAGRQCQGECRAVALGDTSCTGAFLWLQGTAGQAGSIAGAAPGAEPPTTHPGAAQRQDQGSILLWGQHKEAHMVTPGMAMMLSQAGCRAQHCAWRGRSKICPPGFIPFPKTLLGLAAGQWQSQACGWGCPAARQGWGRWGIGGTNYRGASSSSAQASHDQSPPGQSWPGLPHHKETCGATMWGGLRAQHPRAQHSLARTDQPGAAEGSAPFISMHSPRAKGNNLLPHSYRGHPHCPMAQRVVPTALFPVVCWGHSCRSMSHGSVATPLLPRMP